MINVKREDPLLRNLVDAGCPAEVTARFMALHAEGKVAEQITLLQEHRKVLLAKVRDGQRALDCLDYLVYSMRKTT